MPKRYPLPEAGKFTRSSLAAISSVDYLSGVALTTVGLTCFGLAIGFSIAYSILFLVLLIPAALVFAMYWVFWKNTVKMGRWQSGDDTVNNAMKVFDQIRGDYTEQYAAPIMQKIYSHCLSGAHGHGISACSPCDERIRVMRELIPAAKTISDESDLEAALEFIKIRKTLN